MSDEAKISYRPFHLLEIAPIRLSTGTKGVSIQFGHRGEVEAPMCISAWDAVRLLDGLLVALSTHEYQPASEMLEEAKSKYGRDDGWRESGDPAAGPWPPISPPQPPARKPRRPKKK